ncbi:MAG: hypothetical protein RIA69_03485 [Cyclobacteriaceae bacterium]
MEKPIKSVVSFLFFLLITTASYANNQQGDSSIPALVEELNEAVEVRNFHSAREIMDKLFPLMKKELKADKKRLSELTKEENPEMSPEEFKSNYDRKMEVLEFVEQLLNSSPAALRVKSKTMISEIGTFVKLLNSNS